MIWLTSDQHFYHEKINRYENRGYKDTTSMNNDIIKKHNELITKDDEVYHLGDFAFAKNWKDIRSILDRLNGRHHLIIGNHDKLYVWDYCEAGFLTVHTHLQLDDYWLVHDPAVAGVLRDKKWIHGHTHSIGKRLAANTYCVCGELTNYYPVAFEEIKSNFNEVI